MPAIDDNEVRQAKIGAEKLNVPFFELSDRAIPPDVLREISEEAAAFYQILPLAKDEKTLEVGMVDPTDIRAKEALKFITRRKNLTPKIYLIALSDFKSGLSQYRSLKEEVLSALQELEKELAEQKGIPAKKTAQELERIMAEAPITKIVAVFLRHAQEGGASDIHIEPTEERVKVRFRVDGVLHTSLFLPKKVHAAVVSRIKILANLKIDETRIPQDGRFHSVIDNKKIDFRVSTFPTALGEKAVLRLLDPTVGLLSLEEIGLTGRNLRVIEEGIQEPFGMVLLTGPTGSGKTTTLYAIMRILNQEAVNIVSLEDPVEYLISGISQSQIKPEINYTFATGLRSILRQDPDIVMVGEIRDEETADLATHAALTGHIVLSTLHTNNAIGVIPRLVDMGVEQFLIPASLNLGIAQRLIRRLCPHCKKEVSPPSKIKELIEKEIRALPEESQEELKKEVNLSSIKLWQAQGCKFCAKKGTKGRIAIFEVLKMTPSLERITIEGPSEQKIIEEAKRQGMTTMKQDGIIKALKGIVSLEEVLQEVAES